MTNNKDIRWRQRFQNFDKTLKLLEEAMRIDQPDIFQRAGMIQFFEMTFELAWNLIKDYLQEEGFDEIKSPKAAIKKGYETGLIINGHAWMELLEDRNLTSHTYNEKKALEVDNLIRQKYYPLLKQLQESFDAKRNK